LSSGDILAYEISGKKGHGDDDKKQRQPNSARETHVGSAEKSMKFSPPQFDQSLDESRVGSQTERDSTVGTPRIGTLHETQAQVTGRMLATSETSNRGNTEVREAANVTTSGNRPKRQLKEFYEQVLDKDN
jgi:type IV secretory pathway VirB10-like protein